MTSSSGTAGDVAKRLLDIGGAVAGIVVLAPVMLATAIAIRATSPGPSLFRQRRVGLNERAFTIYKFRTMVSGSADDSARITRVGAFLRRTSLDELPQLWNVLIGDMSLVGPRPLLPEYLALYTAEQRRRHVVRPGVTGWSAVNGRNAMSWDEQFRMDIWYVENRSLLLDLRIIARTVSRVLRGTGVSEPGQATRTRMDANR